MMPVKLDNTIQVEIPEGIELTADLAGAPARALAFGIDIAIRFFIATILGTALAFMDKAGAGFYMIGLFLLEWFYPVFFEVLNKGQTPGKKIFDITVVNDDLTPVGWESSIIRNLLRAADFLPFAYLAGLASMLLSHDFKRLGDYAAGTLVIHTSNSRAPTSAVVKARVPPVQLSPDEQKALVAFLHRHRRLSLARQIELANILPALHSSADEEAVKALQAMGAHLLGQP